MMFKLFVFIGLIVFTSACGVDTSSDTIESAANVDGSTTPADNTTTIITDAIDPNPVYTDDTNSTDNTGNTGNTGNIPVNNDQNNSVFDTSGAIEDEFACFTGDANLGYTTNVISDNSNDYVGKSDEEYGVTINSSMSYTDDPANSTVALFYYTLKPARAFEMLSVFVENEYSMYIDKAWALNDESIIYVRTPKNAKGFFGCYRYDVSELNADSVLKRTKVYRLD